MNLVKVILNSQYGMAILTIFYLIYNRTIKSFQVLKSNNKYINPNVRYSNLHSVRKNIVLKTY